MEEESVESSGDMAIIIVVLAIRDMQPRGVVRMYVVASRYACAFLKIETAIINIMKINFINYNSLYNNRWVYCKLCMLQDNSHRVQFL